MKSRPALLLVANWDSGVGYAWWLMESFWVALAHAYSETHRVVLAFPKVTTISPILEKAPLDIVEESFAGSSLADVRRHSRFIKAYRIRTIYFSDRATWAVRYLLYRLSGVRIIVTHDHTPGLRSVPRGVKRLAKQGIQRVPGLSANGVIGATEFVRDRLEAVSCVPASKCYAVPNGLPGRPSGKTGALDVRAEFGIPADREVMVMTGRANLYKGVSFVLEVLSHLTRNDVHGIHFLFVGDGPHLEEFRDQARALGVDGFCSFPGRRNDVAAILDDCDLAVHASRGEVGYSLSILEYMQAGLAVLVPDNPSVCAATEHGVTGWVYRDGEAVSAAEGLITLLGDKTLRGRLGEQAQKTVRRHYSIEHTHAALLRAFQSIDPLFPLASAPRDFR